MKRLFFLFVYALASIGITAQTYTKNVGDEFDIPAPTYDVLKYELYSLYYYWDLIGSSSDKNRITFADNNTSVHIRILEYFSSTLQVKCSYTLRDRKLGTPLPKVAYFYVKCNKPSNPDDGGGDSGGGSGGDDSGGGGSSDDLDVYSYFQENNPEGWSILYRVYQLGGSYGKSVYVVPAANGTCALPNNISGKLTIPSTVRGLSVRGLDQFAIANRDKITEIVLPNTITFVDKWAITNLQSLQSITCLAETPPDVQYGGNTFASAITENVILYVPSQTAKSKYSSARGWEDFKTIKVIGETNPTPSTIVPTGITVSPSSKTIEVGDGFYCSYTISPSNANSQTSVTWDSDDPSIASVSSSGYVTGKKAGSTYINAKTANGKTDWCKVTVTSLDPDPGIIVPTSISVSPSTKTIEVGDGFYCSYIISPSNANSQTSVTWTSDDSSIASVSSSGYVTGKKAGKTYINATTANGKTDWCTVTVETNSVEPTSISLPSSKTVKVGESFTMTYTLTPSNATTTLTWSSDDTSIATVSSSGVVKGIKAGTTKIRVKTSNGMTDYCNVTVEASEPDAIVPTSIRIRPSSLTLRTGDTYSLTYYIEPYNANSQTRRTWSSDDNNIATVSSSGVVTGKKEGLTYIRVRTDNGRTSSCLVSVDDGIYVDDNVGVATISANCFHSLIIKNDKSLWACGTNYSGMLGDGTTIPRHYPVKIMDGVAKVAAGYNYSLIVKTDGSLWAFGVNDIGQLGDGTTTNRQSPVKVMDGVVSVASNGWSSFVIKRDGSLWAFGENDEGQLGDGTKTYRQPSPVKIMDDVMSVSTGGDHTLIIKKDGSLWACGNNKYGQLGDGTTTNRLSPVKIMDDVESVSAGFVHSLIVKNDGTLWVCGDNRWGQLGDGTTTNRLSPVIIMDDVKSVAAGSFLSLIIKNDGSLFACGDNENGQLGDGTTTNIFSPIKITDGVTAVASHGHHILFVKGDGSLWACGENEDGQLGDGTTIDKHYPIRIMEGIKGSIVTSHFGYATFYSSESAYTLPNGLSAQVVTNAMNGKLTYKTIANGSMSGVVPRGTAVMLVSDNKQSGTYTLTSTESKASYSGTNLLQGSDAATTTTGDGHHYKLSYGQPGSNLSNVFGWYWGAQNGAPFQIEGHKAWLVVPKSSSSTRGFAIDGEATGIEMISGDDDEVDAVYYDLQGRRITKPTVKGVYIMNGKKVMVK